MTDLLQSRIGGVEVTPAEKTPIDGIYQTTFDNKYGYLIEGGKYVIIGDLIDLETANNLTEVSRRKHRVDQLAQFKAEDMIVYPAKGQEIESITIFTDTSCPYCKKLHEEVGALQEAGVRVNYLPFPRGSKRGPGYKTLQQVWCAKDRPLAMHVAKGTKFGDVDNDGTCAQASIVDKGFEVGNAIGVTGTPAIINSRGKKLDGYLPFERLMPMLMH